MGPPLKTSPKRIGHTYKYYVPLRRERPARRAWRSASGYLEVATTSSRLRRPVGRFNTELLGVLGVQPLPAAELHRLAADDASNGSSAEKAIQNIETDVPAGSDPRDEAAIDVVPQRQARAATKGFEFPPEYPLYSSTLGASARVTLVSDTAAWAFPPR